MERTLGTLLRALVDQLDGGVQQAYREAGLAYRPRFTPIVRHLEAEGPSTLRAIANAAGVSHSAVSQTVKEMLQLGLVSKEPGRDAREQVVALTADATAMLPSLQACWKRTAKAARNLSDDLGVDLEALLERALAELARRPFAERIATAGKAD